MIFRYFVVAIIGLLVDLTIFFSLIYLFEITYMIAGVTGFIISFFANFMVGRKYVFKEGHRFSSFKHEFYSVFIISLFSLSIHQVVLYVSVEYLVFSVEVAKFNAVFFSFLWNYFGRRYIYN